MSIITSRLKTWDTDLLTWLKHILNRIALMPTASAVRYRNVRCKPMATFPYLIMFTIDEPNHAVHILPVLPHQSATALVTNKQPTIFIELYG
ncbi:MAG: hypothetical protein KF862_24620 [Chitinophagaceae bacterium]|nr:hypothetical protein [Chitinophagaceae bacterium]